MGMLLPVPALATALQLPGSLLAWSCSYLVLFLQWPCSYLAMLFPDFAMLCFYLVQLLHISTLSYF